MRIPKISGFDQDALEKYVKNTGWLMIARVGSLAVKMLLNIALANYLLKVKLGILNYPMTIATFFIAMAALGLDGFVTRELLRDPEKEHKLLGTAFLLKLAGGLLILPFVYLTYIALNHFSPASAPFYYVLIVSLTGIFQSFNIIDSYFQSKTQGKFIMRVQIVANLVSAAIKGLLILLHSNLTWFIFALLFDAALLAFGYFYMYKQNGGNIFKWTFDGKLAKYLLTNSWPLALSAILVTVYMRIDQLMITQYLGEGPLGVYTNPVQWTESCYFIPVAIVTSVFPAIMNARRDDPERYRRRMQNMYDLMVWISLSLAIFVTFAAPFIFELYDPVYAEGAHVLSILIWASIFAFLGTASGQFLIAEGYTKLTMTRTAAGAVVNVVLNIFWIPKYGIEGAAFATLIAFATSTFWILLIPKTRDQGIMMLKSLFLITLFRKLKRNHIT
ncbi:flippase [Pedobacter psychroterrae]|uniref:Flippase n=1 Tax=Pedobacter psychroterrae TaxID=2530453 RepID=A0A4R0NP91_9SPHI|nr:flippase [Pedobacter psychroterrae]TCD02792.1 flippase [Pedobacter psychroterrae]